MIRPVSKEFLHAARRLYDETGALLILDEVQTGFCRTGRFFCCEHYGLVPDILVLAKGMSGGLYPISAAVLTSEVADFLITHPFVIINSFGGTTLACITAMAAIEYMERKDLADHTAGIGESFLTGLSDLRGRHSDMILDVRGKGLMLGIEFMDESIGPRMVWS